MILEGRQIFSFMEGRINLPEYFFTLAVNHSQLHPRKVKGCIKCESFFSVTPNTIGIKEVKKNNLADIIRAIPKSSNRINYEAINERRQSDLDKLVHERSRSKVLKLKFKLKRKE